MDQVSENINYTNHKIHSYDQMRIMVVNLGGKKVDDYKKSSTKLSCPQNSLLMIIVDTTEKGLYNVEGKSDTSKVRTYSLKSISTIFAC